MHHGGVCGSGCKDPTLEVHTHDLALQEDMLGMLYKIRVISANYCIQFAAEQLSSLLSDAPKVKASIYKGYIGTAPRWNRSS